MMVCEFTPHFSIASSIKPRPYPTFITSPFYVKENTYYIDKEFWEGPEMRGTTDWQIMAACLSMRGFSHPIITGCL